MSASLWSHRLGLDQDGQFVVTIGQISIWYLLSGAVFLGALWAVGTAYLVADKLLAVQRLIAAEVKQYLAQAFEDHQKKSAEMVVQDVESQLTGVKEELRLALADVVRAEAAQLVAETAQGVAEGATQAKTDFLSRMSHEIRTPINGIVGSLALLKPPELTVQQAEDLQRAVISADRLMVVVNEVLDLAQIESGKVEYQSVSFDLKDLCLEAVDSFRPLAAEKGLELSCNLHQLAAGGYLSRRLGDQQKLHQVLANLLSNAIKFTARGKVSLVVNAGYGDKLFLVIEDTGRGISIDQQQTLFQPFSGDSADGAGLGLSICQQYVEGMGGQIKVSSGVGVGSTFTVELDLAVDQHYYDDRDDNWNWAETGRKMERELDLAGRPLRILAVDDDEVNRLVLQRHLEQMDCEVTSVVNGLQAVEEFKPGHWDIIFMDLLMPVMDGFEAAVEIRRLESMGGNGSRALIVALTASVVGEIRDRCLKDGMDQFFTKPFDPDLLQGLIQDFRDDYL